MPKLTLDDAHSIPDAFFTHDWNVIFHSIPGGAATSMRQLTLRAQTASIPGRTIEPAVIALKDVEINQPSRQTYSKTLAMTFLEVKDLSTRRTFINWMQRVRDQKSGVGGYKKDITSSVIMELYDAAGNVGMTVKLEFAWPSEVGELNLASPGEPGSLPVTFTFDSVTEE